MKYSHFNILVLFDFSEESISALRNVIEIQKLTGFSIHVLHVVTSGKAEDMASKSAQVFAKMKENFEETGSMKIKVVSGEIGSAAVAYAKTSKADLMFVSGVQLLDAKTGKITKDAKEVLLKISCPVLILNKELSKQHIKSILLPLDLNLENEIKISGSMFFSEFFNNAIVRIASIVYDTDDFAMNKLMHRLQDISGTFDKKGFDCVGEIIRCSNVEKYEMSKTLVDYVDNQAAELVLLVTNNEEDIDSELFHPLPENMIMEYGGNMICINPSFKVKK